MKNCKGLSLIEILVALIITGIIAACVSAAVIGGYSMLKQAEHKSRAMSIAHVKLQEYLAKSFSELEIGTMPPGTESDISQAFKDTLDNTYFNYTVTIEEGKQTGGSVDVPYKNVTVQTVYTEVNTKGQPVNTKTIQLSNMVPYPLIHISSAGNKYKNRDYEAPRTDETYQKTHPWIDPADYKWKDITTNGGVLSFNYPVPKDIIVLYNLAITYNTKQPPTPFETVFTHCTLDGGPTEGFITRTPIMTQVFISNILEIDNVTAGPHAIHVQWSHESNTTQVWLRSYYVTAVAEEHTDKPAVP